MPEDLVTQAISGRPELAGLQMNRDAAYSFERAEKDLSYPTASLMGVGGYMPYIDQITLPRVIPGEYEGVAVNVQIPVLNGGLFKARRQEAHYRALEADQRLRDEAEAIARDVRTAWASSTVAYQRLDVTAELLRQAALAQDLAQGRYDLGLSTIVELTQAQLNVTSAASKTSARNTTIRGSTPRCNTPSEPCDDGHAMGEKWAGPSSYRCPEPASHER